MSKSIPDRWLDYKPYGEVINGTKILPFKVPLKETVAKNLQLEQQFTTSILIKAFPKLKYIIDLTNTTRYYDQADFTKIGVKYQKIMIPGMQVPPLEYVKRFFKAIEKFTEECREDELIGVHCTHGVNRSGYLICRYLVQQLGWKHEDALQAFADARGYAIERVNYVTDLKRSPCNSKLDVSQVKLDVPMKPHSSKRIKHHGTPRPPPFPPMGPPAAPRGFMNGGPFPPPPPGKYGPPRPPAFGPPRPPPSMVGPPPPHGPPMFGPTRSPHGPFGPLPPPPPMRHGPPLPPLPPLPGSRSMRIPGPLRPPPTMGPPGPPTRVPPGMAPRVAPRPGPPRPPPGPPMRLAPSKMAPPKGPVMRAGRSTAKQLKDLDFTADVFEENLTAKPSRSTRKRPYNKN